MDVPNDACATDRVLPRKPRDRGARDELHQDGYDDSNDHTIDIVLTVDDGALRIEVIDDGRPFNPLDAT